MIINLPKQFTIYHKEKGKLLAYIENGVLKYNCNQLELRKVMPDIVYAIHGKKYCAYCEKRIKSKKLVTIDHIVPQDFGGPTISNNLIPSCSKCNNEKGNMTKEEYDEFKRIKKSIAPKKLKRFKEELQIRQRKRRERGELVIPEEWITRIKVEDIVTKTIEVRGTQYKSFKRYIEVKKFYNKYGYFRNFPIVDKNYRLLEGWSQIQICRDMNLKEVDVIVLENVIGVIL